MRTPRRWCAPSTRSATSWRRSPANPAASQWSPTGTSRASGKVLPRTIVVSALNQRLIAESGQLCSSHHVAAALGFGALGLASAIELYDHNHRCVTVLTQTGPACGHLHQAWEAIAASLPDDER
ncbi:hypothetical protein HMPREF9336_03004 [Segniliparus rugosus ATCC BAA-974]|uniref:Uncharacterized protein n=1 Tax=Segniliparus rugosus (strain ATCC BAA-974 / DSM 45345 / CCUG 50838 / CIP 108380 / JCM 13579 / CDC 945) TaxID=679197 RepID=E5XU32_SEGRC|nr:hypothetical protein HMPREF9336_03004 [Segniliparus rugosus ATCC BAA-974]